MTFNKEAEIEMIDSPNKWPKWPLLPIKKREGIGLSHCAVIIDHNRSDGKIRIRTGVSVWDRIEKINTAEIEVFDSTEALVDAGWIVD